MKVMPVGDIQSSAKQSHAYPNWHLIIMPVGDIQSSAKQSRAYPN